MILVSQRLQLSQDLHRLGLVFRSMANHLLVISQLTLSVVLFLSTIVTLQAGTTIAVQPTANTISIPNTGDTTATLSVFRIY